MTQTLQQVRGRDLQVVDKFGRPMPLSAEYQNKVLSEQDINRIDMLSSMFPGAILTIGIAGSGKTTLMGWFDYWFEHYFDIHTVSDFDIRSPKFGGDTKLYNHYKRIDDDEFKEEQEKMTEAVNKAKSSKAKEKARGRLEDDAEQVWDEHGINLHRKVINWDDVHKKFERRRWMRAMTILYSHVLKEHRHYYSLVLMASTDLEDLDLRATKNLTHEITSLYNPQTRWAMYKIWNRDPFNPHWERPVYLYIPHWWNLIYSFQMTTTPRELLGKKKDKDADTQ